MNIRPTTDELAALRGRVIAAIRQIVTWGGLVAIVASVASCVANNQWRHAWIIVGTYAALMLLNWWPGASIDFRGSLLVFVCFASGAFQLLVDATHGSGYQLLVASVVLGGLLLERRRALISSGLIVLSVFIITGLYGLRIIVSSDPAVGGGLWWMSWSFSFAVIAAVLITTQQYIVKQLAQSLRHLREAGAAKDELLAMVSHELRTPLTPVLLILGDMERGTDLSQERREQVAIARGQIELEARLVNDLLDLTRVISNRLELKRSSCDVHGIVRSVVKASANQFEAKQLTLEQQLNASSCVVDSDGDRLYQVMRNLLENASKFTPSGGKVTIGSSNETVDQKPWLILTVQDSGIGMDKGILEKAFDMFEQKDRSITRQYGGMGIGLTICRAIVNQHGGAISATSDGEGKGSTFTIRLPCAISPERPA